MLGMTPPVRDDESFRDAFHENGIKVVQQFQLQGHTPKEIARFLLKTRNLDAKMVGTILGEPDPHSLTILQEYANGFPFKDFSCDVALRAYLGRFILPGEAQKIDRILQAFAKSFFAVNGGQNKVYTSEDAVYTLAFSIVLLNTDAHNPHLARRHKMKKQDFIRNHQRLSEGEKIPAQYLGDFFDSFVTFPIQVIKKKEDNLNEDETELEFGEGPLGLEIETSIDGRTCLVKKYVVKAPATWSCKRKHPLEGWVIVAVGNDCTRNIGYPVTRYLLKTADRPVKIRFCEPSVYFSSLEE